MYRGTGIVRGWFRKLFILALVEENQLFEAADVDDDSEVPSPTKVVFWRKGGLLVDFRRTPVRAYRTLAPFDAIEDGHKELPPIWLESLHDDDKPVCRMVILTVDDIIAWFEKWKDIPPMPPATNKLDYANCGREVVLTFTAMG